jgi:hypothetical protein
LANWHTYFVADVSDALQFVGRILAGELKVEGLAFQGPEAAHAPDG